MKHLENSPLALSELTRSLLLKIKDWLAWHPNTMLSPPGGWESEEEIIQAINSVLEAIEKEQMDEPLKSSQEGSSALQSTD